MHMPFPRIQHVGGLGEMSVESTNIPEELYLHLKESLWSWVKAEI